MTFEMNLKEVRRVAAAMRGDRDTESFGRTVVAMTTALVNLEKVISRKEREIGDLKQELALCKEMLREARSEAS